MNQPPCECNQPKRIVLLLIMAIAQFVMVQLAGRPLSIAFTSMPATSSSIDTMKVATAVMVTVELDFGPKVKKIADALSQIDRRYVPDDGKGRTFAILDAYGERLTDGKLHISMHVSAEKTGVGQLVFRRTREILWNCLIVPGEKNSSTVKNLGVFIDDGHGNSLVLDGSKNPSSILEANVQGMERPIRDIWPNGALREVTFMYSACGCPVKVMVKRIGEKTTRTKEMPVMFPDDPAVVTVINRLMKW